jgi:streptomycin 6-kinase|tara:strand:+ start:11157 stop:12143 length:987 start_codon:yes stop_codon:yes gene_type:complete
MTPLGTFYKLAEDKQEAIIREFGDSGERWVNTYPELLENCVQRWRLKLISAESAGLPINVIFYAETEAGDPVVLKIGHPHREQETEISALRAYDGRYAVRIIEWDDETGAFFMERVVPGRKLRDLSSGIERSRIRIDLVSDLPIPASDVQDFPTFGNWIERAFALFRDGVLLHGTGGEKQEFLLYMELAEQVYARLLQCYPEPYLLHGDLHHENILLDEERGWLAIDPKGVIGPKIMECGRYLHNFIEDEIPGVENLEDADDQQILHVLEERFATFSDMLELDQADIVSTAYVDLVLSSCWSLNSNQQVEFKKLRVLYALLKNQGPAQ